MKKNLQNQILNSIKKGFTLIEMLIVVIIIGIIMSIIFLIYRNMSGVILDSQRIKNISQEILYTNTYIQNISDKSDIVINNGDYNANPKEIITMIDKDTSTRANFKYIIGSECNSDKTSCRIYSQTNNNEKEKLTNPGTTFVKDIKFVTIPFDPIPEDKNSDKSKIKDIYSRGFWMIGEIKGKKSDPDIQSIKIQTFFGTRSY